MRYGCFYLNCMEILLYITHYVQCEETMSSSESAESSLMWGFLWDCSCLFHQGYLRRVATFNISISSSLSLGLVTFFWLLLHLLLHFLLHLLLPLLLCLDITGAQYCGGIQAWWLTKLNGNSYSAHSYCGYQKNLYYFLSLFPHLQKELVISAFQCYYEDWIS